MPTIGVDKAALFKALGQEYSINLTVHFNDTFNNPIIRYTTDEFDELCFEFGKWPLPLFID